MPNPPVLANPNPPEELSVTLPYRLCAIDLDDTLLGPDHRLSARNARAIAAIVGKGVKVVIASGRMFASTLPTARQLDLDTPIVCYNGAMVKHPRTGKVWLEASVPADTSSQIMDYCLANSLQLNFYWNDLLYSEKYTPWLQLYHNRTSSPLEIRPDFYTAMRGIAPTKMIIVDDPHKIDDMLPRMRERFAGVLNVTKSNAEYLEFLPHDADKGVALACVAKHYGISAAQTIAFGDSWNDLPMLAWAGLGVAVGNAKPEVLAAADRVVLASAEDGVGIALEDIYDVAGQTEEINGAETT
ncbi:MAG TPA: Cof-type HAD-IIB family hydrolase [Chthonomonadaceae bacterium]|nr:Cof-type HAD-IIB family hydrolase [Chthonomonadaceae bacterium]